MDDESVSQQRGLCCKNSGKVVMGVMAPFLLSLGCRAKQANETRYLPQHVSFFHAVHMALAKHVHHLIALQGSPPCLEGKEAHPWLNKPFDEPMIFVMANRCLVPAIPRCNDGKTTFMGRTGSEMEDLFAASAPIACKTNHACLFEGRF